MHYHDHMYLSKLELDCSVQVIEKYLSLSNLTTKVVYMSTLVKLSLKLTLSHRMFSYNGKHNYNEQYICITMDTNAQTHTHMKTKTFTLLQHGLLNVNIGR